MDGIEAFREKLYLALEKGNLVEILEISRLLDNEIVCFMKKSMNGQKSNSDNVAANSAAAEERSGKND